MTQTIKQADALIAEASPHRLLSEAQNATFNTEFYTTEEFDAKVVVLKKHFGDRPVRLLDAGGGNGAFTDAILAAFPNWTSTIIDISDFLLAQNKPHDRKRVMKGSIFDIATLFPGEKFDMVSINWVLHHLIGDSYAASLDNIVTVLMSIPPMLAEGGMVCIGENRYQGIFDSNISARLIYEVTAIRNPLIAKLVAAHANTAGVGVCFQSEQAWERLFKRAKLKEIYPRGYARPFNIKGLKKWGLLLKSASKLHFYLVPDKA